MPKKGENIYKRKDGRWEGRYKKTNSFGKKDYGYVYGKTYREVKAKLISTIAQSSIPCEKANSNAPILFETMAFDWIESKKQTIKQSTYCKYTNLLHSYILPAFGKQEIQNMEVNFIENHCNSYLMNGGKEKKGLSSKTVADILSVIRSILQFASDRGYSVSCDARSIHVKQQTKEMRILTKNEQEKLCQYLVSDPNTYNVGILVCLFTGLRVGEVCALHWEDISFPDRTMHIHQTMQRIQEQSNTEAKTSIIVTAPKSPCSVRTIPLPDELIKVLSKYQTSSTGFFLSNSQHAFVEPRTMQNRYKQVLKVNSIAPANFHSLRHTFATRCVELGFDVKTLSEILGHASVNITMNRYVHPTMELKQQNMERLSSLFAVK